jgi:hypothetical protein
LRPSHYTVRNRLRQSLPISHANKVKMMAACYDPALAEELQQRQLCK